MREICVPSGILLTILRLTRSPVKQNINFGSRAALGFRLRQLMLRSIVASAVGGGPENKKCAPASLSSKPVSLLDKFPACEAATACLGLGKQREARPRAGGTELTSGGHPNAAVLFVLTWERRPARDVRRCCDKSRRLLKDRSFLKSGLNKSRTRCAGAGHKAAPSAREAKPNKLGRTTRCARC